MKNSKKGISLIVLVITIIVIIILAAAVIITLNNNNPISSANQAKYASDKANMQAIFTNVVGKIMTHNQAVVSITPNGDIKESVNYTLVDAADAKNATGIIEFGIGVNVTDGSDSKWFTGKALPRYKAGDTVWSVDDQGNIGLKVGTSFDESTYTK